MAAFLHFADGCCGSWQKLSLNLGTASVENIASGLAVEIGSRIAVLTGVEDHATTRVFEK
jgi:hypothetical protein